MIIITSTSPHSLFHEISSPLYSRIDPAQEFARLRHSISLLESHIFSNHRSHVLPSTRRSDIIPKKEIIDADIPGKPATTNTTTNTTTTTTTAPGMLASQVQGGLYAGPTSAATHLIIVSWQFGLSSPSLIRTHTPPRVTIDPQKNPPTAANRVSIVVINSHQQTTTVTCSPFCRPSTSSMVSSRTITNTAVGYIVTSTWLPFNIIGTDSRMVLLQIVSSSQLHALSWVLQFITYLPVINSSMALSKLTKRSPIGS